MPKTQNQSAASDSQSSTNRPFRPAVFCLADRFGRLDPDWLRQLRLAFPESLVYAWPSLARQHGLRQLQVSSKAITGTSGSTRVATVIAALDEAAAGWPRHGLLLIRSGLQLPPRFAERLQQIHPSEQAPVLTVFPGNYDERVNPAAGLDLDLEPEALDSLIQAAADKRWTPIGELPHDCCYVHGSDAGLVGRRLDAPGEQALIDDVFVFDADRSLGGGRSLLPASRAAFGQLRQALHGLLADGLDRLPLFGLDGRPVTLHISHSWGGGITQWITDVCAHDPAGHHLVLCSSGQLDGMEHGQSLVLYAAGPGRGKLREFVLTPPIADTVSGHAQYRAIVRWLARRYGVGRVIVSSLIGHSLDCLRTELPTAQMLHDFYPATPILHADPLSYIDAGGRLQMQRALDDHRSELKFANDTSDHWRQVRNAWLAAATRYKVCLMAPSRHVALRWQTLFGEQLDEIAIQGHGFDSPWAAASAVKSIKRADGKLTLVVVGRQSAGKGLGLLDQALDRLAEHARIVLVGAGKSAEAFFGRAGVDIILDYEREQLPELLESIGPHAALFLSTVPETWNYVLSETRSLGLVPVATAVGSFPERIEHGKDGILFEPTPEALVAAIAELAANPDKLVELSAEAADEPGLDEAIKRYNQICPGVAHPARVMPWPAESVPYLHTSLFDLARQTGELVRLRARIDDLQDDLARRSDWALRQQRLAEERTRWAKNSTRELDRVNQVVGELQQRTGALDQELIERTAWARSIEQDLAASVGRVRELEEDLCDASDRTEQLLQHNSALDKEVRRQRLLISQQVSQIEHRLGQIAGLEANLEANLAAFEQHVAALERHIAIMSNSLSWRITRPLRFAARVTRKLIAQRAWNPLLWPGLTRQLVRSLRQHGLAEFLVRLHRQPPPIEADAPAPEVVAEIPPIDDVEPARPEQLAEPVAFDEAIQPVVSIVIPVYNKVELTAACLHSVASAQVNLPFEVIVVDDCSSDETESWLGTCTGLTCLRNKHNAGFIDSCNRGADSARGEFVVFLNNDTTVADGWLDALVEPFHRDREVGVVGAKLVYPDGRLQEAGGIIFSDGSGWNYGRGQQADLPQYSFLSEADYVSGACLSVRRADFETLGGFDVRFRPAYYEDTDLCFQIRAMGKKVLVQPAATVVHHEGATSGTDESSGTKQYQVINREKFLEKWAEVLDQHPAPEPDFERADPVRHIRFRRQPRRLLLIDAVTPQPDHDSGSVRIVAMMTLLRDMGFQVSFMAQNLLWVEGYSAQLQQAGIEVLCAPQVGALTPWLAEHGRDLDLVVVSRHYILQPILDLIRQHCPEALLVFDTVDLHFLREEREAEVTGSTVIAEQARQTRAQELALIDAADVTLVVSPVEQELLEELVPDSDIRIVSNIHTVHGCRHGWKDRKDLMFVGGFQHVPNVDAARWLVDEIFPAIHAEIPDIALHLIGSRMPGDILSIDRPGVHVHGFVQDLEPFLDRCRVSVAPLRYGAGVKGKVNQAMSHGLPVVATTCAAEGMFLDHERDVLVADSAADFARQVVRVHQDPSLWQQLSEGGLNNVERHFSRAAARRALEGIVALVERN